MEETTYSSWLPRIKKALQEIDTIPLLKAPISFDWPLFSNKLKERFSLSSLEFSLSEQQWKSKEELNQQMGENPQIKCFTLSPINGEIFLIMAKQDIHKCTALLLKKSFSSDLLEEGFYSFALLHGLDSFTEMNYPLAPKMDEMQELKAPFYLCQEILIKSGKVHFSATLALSPTFRESWNRYFQESIDLFEKEIASQIEIPISIIVGKTPFHALEWERIKKGDFFVFDRITYDPKHDRRMVSIHVGNTTLFHGKWKHDKIKLLDYALYQEETVMEPPVEETPEEGEISLEMEQQKSQALKKVPLELIVEIARIKMTLDKLISLQPGNVLNLSLSPNESVNLVVNGKKIAKGEIVLIGETLGVRILEIGK